MAIVGEIGGVRRELKPYAQEVLPSNGCAHGPVWHDFIANGTHRVRCMDCGSMHTFTSSTKKVYLAARYEWKERMCEVAAKLEMAGIEVTSRWIRGDCDGLSDAEVAQMDLEDLSLADTLVLFSDEHRGVGRHIEFGVALGTDRRLFVVDERESVFHHLPHVVVCTTVEDLISRLGSGNLSIQLGI